jgi:hypothetical protein
MKEIFLAIGLALAATSARADQLVDLAKDEIQAANFMAKCSQTLGTETYTVLSGIKGTFEQGISYSFALKSANGKEASLQVRWEKATRAYSCDITEN